MKLVRIVCEAPSDAADLISFLENRGFVVQACRDDDPHALAADIEIDLRVVPVETAIQIARELAAGDVDVFIAPGVLADARTEPTVYATSETYSIAAEQDELPSTPGTGTPDGEAEPALASPALRQSIAQLLHEARLTKQECFALIAAELLNASEQTRTWLAQTRVVIIRKRAVLEARAVKARSVVESRLRFDSTSQNAWIRSAFAGAGLMVVLLSITLWNTRGVSATHVNPSTEFSSTKAAPLSSPASSTRAVAAVLHGRAAGKSEIIAANDEVVIRRFQRPIPKSAVDSNTKSSSDIKHISDMN